MQYNIFIKTRFLLVRISIILFLKLSKNLPFYLHKNKNYEKNNKFFSFKYCSKECFCINVV